MKLFYRKKTVDNEQKAGGGFHLPLWSFLQQNIQIVFVIIFLSFDICFPPTFLEEFFTNVILSYLNLFYNSFFNKKEL